MKSTTTAFCLCGVAAGMAVAMSTVIAGAGWVAVLGLSVLSGVAVGALSAASLGQGFDRARRAMQAAQEEAAGLREKGRELEDKVGLTKEYFTNTVHELRTPLTTILAALDMLREDYSLSEADRSLFLDQATAATRHITFLINDMLDTAAVEMGRLSMHVRKVHLNDVLSEIRQVMEPLAQAQGVNLVIEEPEDGMTVLGDPNRVLQVSFNLISNAIKYSNADTTVIVRTFSAPQAAVVEVEDQGIGVALQARKRLFTKFSRVHNSGDSEAAGSGIGLYLSRVLIRQMGGSIGYRSNDNGRGSVFWYTLPSTNEPAASAMGGNSAG